MISSTKLLLIGAGVWGKNYIKTLQDFNVDLDIANRSNWKQLIDKNPDGVIICTPPQSHIEIAKYSLTKDIPTMIEKPISLSLPEVIELTSFSAPILVNYIHLFSKQYQYIKKIIDVDGIKSISSQGFNVGPFRDYSSLWDYGPHDLSMILDLLDKEPNTINAHKLKLNNGEMYYIELVFDKVRTTSVIGNGGTSKRRFLSIDSKYIYDDSLPSSSKPLSNAIEVFINSINGIHDYRLGLDLSIKITKILDLCSRMCK